MPRAIKDPRPYTDHLDNLADTLTLQRDLEFPPLATD
jgi:hypothetical protein